MPFVQVLHTGKRMEDEENKKNVFNKGMSADSAQVLQLSLFIMLLAFFIVLNVTSNFENNKVKPVIESLYKAFSTDLSPRLKTVFSDPKTVTELQKNQSIHYLEEFFKSDIPQIKADAQVDESRGVLTLGFKRSDFENAIFNSEPVGLDSIVATLIYLAAEKDAFSVEVVLKTPNRASETEIQSLVVQGDSYVRRLERRGILKKYLSFGLSDTVKDDVTMVFRPYFTYAPPVVVPDAAATEEVTP